MKKTHTFRYILILFLAIIVSGCTTLRSIAQPEEDKVSLPITYNDLVILESPTQGQILTSPVQIKGKARGSWFFEATFPVQLVDFNGVVVTEGFATADGDWMTEDYVPFTVELVYDKPEFRELGNLILRKANASGLPENDDALDLEVEFE